MTLVEVPETFVQGYSVQLAKGSTKQIAGWVQLNGPKLQQTVTIRIPEANSPRRSRRIPQGVLSSLFDADLPSGLPRMPNSIWSRSQARPIKSPTASDSVPLMSAEPIFCSTGKSIFLRGMTSMKKPPRSPDAHGAKTTRVRLLGWAKELGCNFVRLAHYPHNEAMLRMADQMGIMVWGEVPVYWTIQWENPATLRNAENQLNEMIARDQNRAALIIYSVANETPISDARNLFLREMIQDAHSTDPTRLVSAALQSAEVANGNRSTVHIDDPIANDLDVLGNNEYIGWYTGRPEDTDSIDWVSQYDKPLIMSEFGGDALLGYHGDAHARWTEEYQENLYEHQIAMLKRISFLRGTSPWILKDFRSPRRTLPRFEDYFNRKGLVSDHGEKKKAFFVLQKYYRELQSNQPFK